MKWEDKGQDGQQGEPAIQKNTQIPVHSSGVPESPRPHDQDHLDREQEDNGDGRSEMRRAAAPTRRADEKPRASSPPSPPTRRWWGRRRPCRESPHRGRRRRRPPASQLRNMNTWCRANTSTPSAQHLRSTVAARRKRNSASGRRWARPTADGARPARAQVVQGTAGRVHTAPAGPPASTPLVVGPHTRSTSVPITRMSPKVMMEASGSRW
jgi:hypothetical protein